MRDKPRILHVVTHLSLGGAEKVSFEIMTALSDEFSFAVFASGGTKRDAVAQRLRHLCDQSNIRVYEGSGVKSKNGGLLLSAWRMSRALRHFRPEIVHLHTEIPEATYAL